MISASSYRQPQTTPDGASSRDNGTPPEVARLSESQPHHSTGHHGTRLSESQPQPLSTSNCTVRENRPQNRTANQPRQDAPPHPSPYASIPRVSSWRLLLFELYVRRYLTRHFHALRVASEPLPPWQPGLPVVIYSNHPSWWDPLVCLILAQTYFPTHRGYAPIDAAALEQYPLFKKLGFFGVQRGTRRGAQQFLRTSCAVLNQPHSMLWLTPQGRLTDVRERPLGLKSGIGHLAARLSSALFIPLAIEYPFWDERTPEALVQFGRPFLLKPDRPDHTPMQWTQHFEQELTRLMDHLATLAHNRDRTAFDVLLHGKSGVNTVYDAWRKTRALLTGRTFHRQHALASGNMARGVTGE